MSLDYRDFDVLASIWILASRDKVPLITYYGLKYRLDLPKDLDVRKLVESRGELFRQITNPTSLYSWKKRMLEGKDVPSWMEEMEHDEEREAMIEEMDVTDVFRSQFRPHSNDEPSSIEIVTWGLEHIERLRKAAIDKRAEKWRIVREIVPVITVVGAFAAILCQLWTANKNATLQFRMIQYQVSAKPKQDAYISFMSQMATTFEHAYRNHPELLLSDINSLTANYYSLEPFLDNGSRKEMWDQFWQFTELCYTLKDIPLEDKVSREKLLDKYLTYNQYFHDQIMAELFRD